MAGPVTDSTACLVALSAIASIPGGFTAYMPVSIKPRANKTVAVGDLRFEVDLAWPSRRLVAELDGRAYHGTPSAFESDRRRDQLLAAAGWRVIRATWRQVADEPESLTATIRTLLTA